MNKKNTKEFRLEGWKNYKEIKKTLNKSKDWKKMQLVIVPILPSNSMSIFY
jgi:hypothetical protein